MNANTEHRHRLLACGLVSIEFPNSHTCRLNLPSGHCTDMTGAIRVAKEVTRNLEGFELTRVETVAQGEWSRSTVYIRPHKKARWSAWRVQP